MLLVLFSLDELQLSIGSSSNTCKILLNDLNLFVTDCCEHETV